MKVYINLQHAHDYVAILEAVDGASDDADLHVDLLGNPSGAQMVICRKHDLDRMRKEAPNALIGIIASSSGHSASGTPDVFTVNPENLRQSITEQFLAVVAVKVAQAEKDQAALATVARG